MVPEAKHSKTLPLEPCIALCIPARLICVLSVIHFDDYLLFKRYEISDGLSYRFLPSEFYTNYLLRTQIFPQQTLSGSHVPSEQFGILLDSAHGAPPPTSPIKGGGYSTFSARVLLLQCSVAPPLMGGVSTRLHSASAGWGEGDGNPYPSPFCPTNWSAFSLNSTLKVVSEP